jgi:hypothetical protein
VKDFAEIPDCDRRSRKLQNLHPQHIEAVRRSSARPIPSAGPVDLVPAQFPGKVAGQLFIE